MSRDSLNEQAALYALDLLEGEELRQFELELARKPELRDVVEHYAQTSDLLVFTADEAEPPTYLEDRIFSQIPDIDASEIGTLGAGPADPQVAADPEKRGFAWFPWGVAAVFALTSAVLWNQRGEIYDQLVALQGRYADQLASFETQQAERIEQVNTLEAEVRQLASDGALQNLRIAVLKSKLEAAPNAQAIAVWNAAQQLGRLTVSELPALADNQDYQLWIIDPAYEAPVSAGVFNTNENGELEYSFSGAESISSINAFALSLESKGGNPTPQGPIVLVSN